MRVVLNVTEKPSVARQLHYALSSSASSEEKLFSHSKFNSVHKLEMPFLGEMSNVIVTSVTGHIKGIKFRDEIKSNWRGIDPLDLITKEPIFS